MRWLRALRQAPVTCGLLAANIVLFIAMLVMVARSGGQLLSFDMLTLVRAGANVVPSPESSLVVVGRWVTAALIHVNVLHIVMNMMVLVQLGVLSERFVGGGLLAATYVVTGVCGNALSSALATARDTPLVSAGASGAIMGLLGLVAVLALRAGMKPLAWALLRNAGFIIAVGVVLSLSGNGFIDNGAHVGGLAAGAGLGWLRARVRRPMPPSLDRVLTVVAAAVILAALVTIWAGARAGG
jgi:rhomboid protease GluP